MVDGIVDQVSNRTSSGLPSPPGDPGCPAVTADRLPFQLWHLHNLSNGGYEMQPKLLAVSDGFFCYDLHISSYF